jgi:hypothetical protein
MTPEEGRMLLQEHWGSIADYLQISASILLSNIPPDITCEQFITGVNSFTLRHRRSWWGDANEYWLGQNPFDGLYHLFSARAGSGIWPEKPILISPHYPLFFDDEMD